MISTSIFECQKLIYDNLILNASFMSLIGNRIFDEPPTDSIYPYVVLNQNFTEVTDNTLRRLGFNTTITSFIFTKSEGLGWHTATSILEEMNETLNCKVLQLDNLHGLFCKLDNSMSERQDDKRILHVRYRLWSAQKNLQN